VTLTGAGLTLGLGPPRIAEAAAWQCTRYVDKDGRDWAYLYCNKGKSLYYADFDCIHWIGSIAILATPDTSIGKAGTYASIGWCPDGFHVRHKRIRKIVLP
jgi:hypothetical protein